MFALDAVPAFAHSLGIDQAELKEYPKGTYVLIAKVPQSLAYLIAAPELPDRCVLSGSPRGRRGPAEVSWAFACDEPLTARDMLVLPWQREGVLLTTTWADGTSTSQMVTREGAVITIDLALFQAGSGSWLAAAERYLGLGVEHILLGIDHLLFVLALLMIVDGWRKLIATVTAFTLAHSMTLAAATLGWVNVPQSPVEAVIALSIVFVCMEIVHWRQGRPGAARKWPWIVAFVFGLLHGFGFAGALADIGLPENAIPLALLFFNVGVELGQLTFIGGVFIVWSVIGRLGVRWPEWAWRVPVYVIGTLAAFWTIERIAKFV